MPDEPSQLPPLKMEMGHALAFLSMAHQIASKLDGTETNQEPRTGGQSNRRRAEQSADLLRGASVARAAAAEFDMQYWRLKGHEDPRVGVK